MDMHVVIQIITAGTGSLGFSLLFRVKKGNIPAGVAGAILCWTIFLFADKLIHGVLVPSLIAAALGTLFCELSAKVMKAPVTVFLVPTLIPLVPGGSLYYALYFSALQYWEMASLYGNQTLQYVLGIAGGVSGVLALTEIHHRYQQEKKKH